MNKALAVIFAMLLMGQAFTQPTEPVPQNDTVYRFSLDDAINYALEHNVQIINGKLDVKKAKWQIWQTTAMGLPQVKGNISYKQYPELPTQLMPNFIAPVIYQVNMQNFGLQPVVPLDTANNKIPVQFGSEYNASWGIQVNQLIFSGEYIVGLQASRIFKELTEQKYQKSVRDLKASVEQSYVLLLIARESKRILDETYENTLKLKENTEQLVASGMGEPTQVDQMNYVVYQLENQIKTIDRQEKLAERLLKFQLGLNFDDSLVLTTSLDELKNKFKLGDYLNDTFSIRQNIDYKLVLTQEHLAKLDLRREETKLLPKVMGFYTYSKNAMRDQFNFFDNTQPWFKTELFGFQVDIPLWGSGSKIASISQKKIDYLKAQNTREMMEQQLNIQYLQARTNFINAYERLLNEERNIELTKKIYEDTKIKYLNGAASSLELTQAQNQYLQAEGNYYNALMDLVKAKTELEKFLY